MNKEEKLDQLGKCYYDFLSAVQTTLQDLSIEEMRELMIEGEDYLGSLLTTRIVQEIANRRILELLNCCFVVEAVGPGANSKSVRALSEERAKEMANDAVHKYGFTYAEVFAVGDDGIIINSDQGDCLYYVHRDMDEQRRMPKKSGFFERVFNWLKVG
jgi:hypothetical protein